ncbi:hypothetical protein ACFX19_031794 [Malus domestica]
MSAQETTPGHFSSSFSLISSMTSNPDKDKFGTAAFSAVLFAVEFNKIEPSQPCRRFHVYLVKQVRRLAA